MDAFIALWSAAARPLLICLLSASALVGLLAVVSPRVFSRVLTAGNYSVDTHKLFRIPDWKLFRISDKWVDTDRFAVRYVRVTGIVILLGAAIVSGVLFV